MGSCATNLQRGKVSPSRAPTARPCAAAGVPGRAPARLLSCLSRNPRPAATHCLRSSRSSSACRPRKLSQSMKALRLSGDMRISCTHQTAQRSKPFL